MTLRPDLLLICAGLLFSCDEGGRAPVPVLVEPVTHASQGTFYTVQNLDKLRPMSDVQVVRGSFADWAEGNGAIRIDEANLESVIVSARPLSPDDKLFKDSHFNPWVSASFNCRGQKWSVSLYLGGIGFITDQGGRAGAFHFDAAAPDTDR